MMSSLSRWFRSRRGAIVNRATGRKKTTCKLYLEMLEDRTVPTAVAAPSGLVSWWTANNTAADAMGLNDATLSNVTYATGEVGKAFSFNGTNGWAALGDPSSLAFTSSLSIEGWIKVNAFSSSGGVILFRGDDRPGLDPYILSADPDGTLKFHVQSLTTGSDLKIPLATGQLIHVAATLDDATGSMSLYVNGVLAAQTVTTARPFGPLDPTQQPGVGIGNSNAPSNYNVPFNGLIDELSVYNRALTPGEVFGIYKAGSSGKVISPIAVDGPSVIDGSGGATTPITFTITRSGTGAASTVYVSTAPGSASTGDFAVVDKLAVEFAAYETTKTVKVNTYVDNLTEGTESFTLGLYKAVTDTTTIASASGFIKDAAVASYGYTITSSAGTAGNAVIEGGQVAFTVTRSGSGSASTVYLSTSAGTDSSVTPFRRACLRNCPRSALASCVSSTRRWVGCARAMA